MITVIPPDDRNIQGSTAHNPGNKTYSTSLLHPSGNRQDVSLNYYDNPSFDDFGGMLFKNHHEDISKNNNNLHLLGELTSSTPSVPSAMQTPVTMDSSVADLSNIRLFVRMCNLNCIPYTYVYQNFGELLFLQVGII